MPNWVFWLSVVASVVLLVVQPPDVNATRRYYRRRPPPRRYGSVSQSYTCTLPKRDYLFAVDLDVEPFLYLNSNGTLVGFIIDVIEAVCGVARKTCRWSSLPFDVCSTTVNEAFAPGDYLMGGQVDACTLATTTTERLNSVDFTDPFYLPSPVYFIIRSADVGSFNQGDLSGSTVVLMNGWYTNELCIRENGVTVTGTTVNVVNTVNAGIAALKTGQADVFFFSSNLGQNDPLLTSVVANIHCGAGIGIMVKRGSDIPAWWNPAFKKLVASGGYASVCAAAQGTHNGDARCIPF